MIARVVRQVLLLLAVALVPAWVCGSVQLQGHSRQLLQPGEIRVEDARPLSEHALFVDARSLGRYEAGHIPNAVRLTAEEWDALLLKFLDAWEPDRPVIVYCDGGGCDASREIAERIKRELQIQSVQVLQGGYPAWQAR